MSVCKCEQWIQSLPVPDKVIILRCSYCETQYTLYPNGEIAYQQVFGGIPAGQQ